MPAEFFVRVRGCEKEYGDTVVAREPRFAGYFVTGAIQFNAALKHFRYVRVDFTRATVIGTNPSARFK